MTDIHLQILGTIARDAQRRLDDHDDADQANDTDQAPNAASAQLRQELKTRAARTRARLTDARARRGVPK